MSLSEQALLTVRDGAGELFGQTPDEVFSWNMAMLAGGVTRWVCYEDDHVVGTMRDDPDAGVCVLHVYCSGSARQLSRAMLAFHVELESLTSQPCAVTLSKENSITRAMRRYGWVRSEHQIGFPGIYLWTLSLHTRN